MENLKIALNQIDKSLVEDILGKFKPWGKKKILVSKGSIADKIFFLDKGFALLTIQFKGSVWVRHIAQSGEFITSLESFENKVESGESIFALGDFDIYYINKHDLDVLRNRYSEVDKIYHNYLTKSLIACQRRIEDLLCLKAEQYYEKLLREKSVIMNSIPQHELAKYLGIKPQSLSRIRGLKKGIS